MVFPLRGFGWLSEGVKSDMFVKATTPKQMNERSGVTPVSVVRRGVPLLWAIQESAFFFF